MEEDYAILQTRYRQSMATTIDTLIAQMWASSHPETYANTIFQLVNGWNDGAGLRCDRCGEIQKFEVNLLEEEVRYVPHLTIHTLFHPTKIRCQYICSK